MRVIVDRESVSMGDDVDPHAEVWEMPDDTRVGEVVARMAEEYLNCSGSAAWTVEALPGARVYRENGEVVWVGAGGRVGAGERVIPCALVAYPTIWPLDTAVAAAEVREVVAPTPSGEYAFRARYHSRGRPVPLAEYRVGIRDRTR